MQVPWALHRFWCRTRTPVVSIVCTVELLIHSFILLLLGLFSRYPLSRWDYRSGRFSHKRGRVAPHAGAFDFLFSVVSSSSSSCPFADSENHFLFLSCCFLFDSSWPSVVLIRIGEIVVGNNPRLVVCQFRIVATRIPTRSLLFTLIPSLRNPSTTASLF